MLSKKIRLSEEHSSSVTEDASSYMAKCPTVLLVSRTQSSLQQCILFHLHTTRHEGVHEKEAREPEHRGLCCIDPSTQRR
jgi:hypothetical protein